MKTIIQSHGDHSGWRRAGFQSCGIALLAALAAGCGNQNPPGTNGASATTPLSGAYTGISVNGKPIPCTIQHEHQPVLVKSVNLTFNPDGTCVSTSVFSVAGHSDMNREVKASYECRGTNVVMRWHGAGVTQGTLQDNTFTMNNEEMIFVYRK